MCPSYFSLNIIASGQQYEMLYFGCLVHVFACPACNLRSRLSIILQQDPKLFEGEHYMCKKPLPLWKKKSDMEI
jgi:hypothetical protein